MIERTISVPSIRFRLALLFRRLNALCLSRCVLIRESVVWGLGLGIFLFLKGVKPVWGYIGFVLLTYVLSTTYSPIEPRLISEAYGLLFIEKKAPSNLVLVSGDKDYETMLGDYEKQGRKVAVCFYQPVGGGASMDLLTVRGAELIDFTNPKQSWIITWGEKALIETFADLPSYELNFSNKHEETLNEFASLILWEALAAPKRLCAHVQAEPQFLSFSSRNLLYQPKRSNPSYLPS